MRPLALANLLAAVVAIGVALVRLAPLVLCVLVVLTFSGPWTFAVLRRATLDVEADDAGQQESTR